jgi:hypothetical protein
MREQGYEAFLLFPDRFPTHFPHQTTLVSNKANRNVLYSTLDDVGKLWPDFVI